MAIYNGSVYYKNCVYMGWIDSNRKRITVWARSDKYPSIFSKPIGVIWTSKKDWGFLEKRAKKIIEKYMEE